MGKLKIKYFIYTLIIIIFSLSIYSCDRLSRHKYSELYDSLNKIKVPLIFDSIRFFSQRTNVEIDSITPEGVIIQETRDAFLKFHRCTRHKDSIFEYIYDYDSSGFLERFYHRYIYSCNDYPTGYIIYYNKKGEVESFSDLWYDKETGAKAKYNIHHIINKFKNEGIDLLKYKVCICYTNLTQRKNEDFSRHDKQYWIVIINYYHDYEVKDKKIKYQRKLRISPDTGEILEDWIEEWE